MKGNGTAFLLKFADSDDSTLYRTVAGLRLNTLSISGEAVSVTAKDFGDWRELIDGAGTRSVSITASGIFLGSNAEAQARSAAMGGALTRCQLSFESGDRFTGLFLILKLNYAVDFNGERNYFLSLESSGEVALS